MLGAWITPRDKKGPSLTLKSFEFSWEDRHVNKLLHYGSTLSVSTEQKRHRKWRYGHVWRAIREDFTREALAMGLEEFIEACTVRAGAKGGTVALSRALALE